MARDANGQWLFAPAGELVSFDGERLVICHACGAGLTHLSAGHLRRHGLSQADYRARYGLNRGQPLMAPAMVRQRVEEGHRRVLDPRVAQGLAIGQAMARSGELVIIGQAAQRDDQRLQRRTAAAARLATARLSQEARSAARRLFRARQLGYPTVEAYLHSAVQEGKSSWAVSNELRCGRRVAERLLSDARALPGRDLLVTMAWTGPTSSGCTRRHP